MQGIKCPYCGSTHYDVDDYEERFDEDWAQYEWRCKCVDCRRFYYETRTYKCIRVEVTKEEDM